MRFSEFPYLDQIKDRTPTANGFDGRCPAHDDQHASLSVGLGDDGRLLLHCHAGCSPADVLRALGQNNFAAAMPKRGKKRKKKAGKCIASYDYGDENGHRLYQVLRFFDEKTGKKTFSQRRPAKDDGKWVYSLKGVRRVLYRLPQLLAADPKQPVYIVEGEKDVHTLENGGFVATCNSGGADGWTDDITPPLKDRDVVLIQDNDAAGKKWVNTVGNSLTGIARSIRVIRFPDEKVGFDITDWSDSHEPGELAKLTVFAPHFEPTEESGDPDDTRVEVEVNEHEENVTAAVSELLGASPGLYQRGDELVHVVESSPKCRHLNLPEAPRIKIVSPALLRSKMSGVVKFMKPSPDGEMPPQPVHPPEWCVKAVHSAGRWETVRQLNGVSDIPILRPDGSILAEPGYDPVTGLLLVPRCDVPTIPSNPSGDAVREAVADLLEIVIDFPFSRPEHQAAWLASVVTALGRSAFPGPAPLFLIDANVRGSGKSLLADLVAVMATGRNMPRMANPRDEDETRKRILSLAMLGDPLVLIDNIAGRFGNAECRCAIC